MIISYSPVRNLPPDNAVVELLVLEVIAITGVVADFEAPVKASVDKSTLDVVLAAKQVDQQILIKLYTVKRNNMQIHDYTTNCYSFSQASARLLLFQKFLETYALLSPSQTKSLFLLHRNHHKIIILSAMAPKHRHSLVIHYSCNMLS